eukprot:EG_transcript_15906
MAQVQAGQDFALHQPWSMWSGKWKGSAQMQFLARFNSVMSFWSVFAQHPPDSLADQSHLHVFKYGVAPIWEDPNNASGGYFKVTATSAEASYVMWRLLVLNMIGEQYPHDLIVNGTTIVINKAGNNICKVWLSSCDKRSIAMAKDFLTQRLEPSLYVKDKLTFVPHKIVMESAKQATLQHPSTVLLPVQSSKGSSRSQHFVAIGHSPSAPPPPASRHVAGFSSSREVGASPPASPGPAPEPRKKFTVDMLMSFGKLLQWAKGAH